MYEERKEGFVLRDIILQVLFVALFVFILMWLFPTKNFVTNYVDGAIEDAIKDSLKDYEFGGGINSEAFANQLFNQNVMMMKNAAKDYFTLERLPQKNGDQVKITLKKMLDEKIILPFVDSKGQSCSVEESYVMVTKKDTEYLMKVNLKCSDYEDYLLVHMGCYDYCSTTICESKKPDTPTKDPVNPTPNPSPVAYEYEYQLVVDGRWGEWSNWSEWGKNIVSKTDYREVETKVEKEIDGYVKVPDGTQTETIDATETVKYVCPDGYTLTEDKKCVKVDNVTDIIPATEKTTYTCPNGYSLSGDMCYRYSENQDTVAPNISITYTCPSSYMQNGSYCYRTLSQFATEKTTYTCPDGYTLSGTKCKKTTTKTVSATKNITCPSGYSVYGNQCKSNSSIAATASTTYSDWTYSKQITSYTTLSNTDTEKYVLAGTKVNSSCKDPCTNKYIYTYNVYTRTVKTSYSCPSGYKQDGSKCYKVINGTESYKCPSSDYTLNGTKCTKTVTDTVSATAKTTYVCPSGYNLSYNTCTKQETIPATESRYYYCDSGYALTSNNTCVKTSSSTEMVPATPVKTYSCPKGYKKNGKVCFKEGTATDIKPAQEEKQYSCPEGYTLNNNKCQKEIPKYKDEPVYKDVTYYRSRTREYLSGYIDYKWSRSQNDLNLIKLGYTLTGNSRTVQ